MTQYERKCPSCSNTVYHMNKYRRNYSQKHNIECVSCGIKKMVEIKTKNVIHTRTCPQCTVELKYKNKRNRDRADVNNSVCSKCAIRNTPEVIERIRKSTTGRQYPNRASNTKSGKVLPYKRKCAHCDTELSYASKYAVSRANRENSVCNSCSSTLYKKSWQYVIKDDHVKKMAAKKAGYDSYDDYMKELDSRKKYYREVRNITRKQDLSLLENYDKIRGLCGVEGAYQLDHIIPISIGYSQSMSPAVIGSISNLQIIPWKDNLLKSNQNPT